MTISDGKGKEAYLPQTGWQHEQVADTAQVAYQWDVLDRLIREVS